MRGALFIVVLIALLVVGALVIKEMNTETVDGVKKQEIVKKAEEAVDAAEEAMNTIKKRIEKSN